MLNFVVLSFVQVMQGGSSGDNAVFQCVNAKALQRSGLEMLGQQIHGVIGGKHPIVETCQQDFVAKLFFKGCGSVFLDDNLRRFEILQEFVDITFVSFGQIKLTGGNIHERNSYFIVGKMDTCQKIVFFLLQHLVVGGDTGSDQFGDTAFDDGFGKFRVFQLFAYSHAQASAHQFGQVGVNGMMGKASHIYGGRCPVGLLGQHNAENLRCPQCVIAVSLIEVTHTHQEQGIGMLRLELVILLD